MRINIIVYLLDIVNGSFGHYETEGCVNEDGELDLEWWTSGTGSCDCTRSQLLYEREEEEYLHLSCNIGPNRIKILSIVGEGQGAGECLWEGDYVG